MMWRWAKDLFPIARSLSGPGARETLAYLTELLPNLSVEEVPSGCRAGDWTIPQQWSVREAWIEGPDGQRFADYAENPLHLVGYSQSYDGELGLDDLEAHLFSLPEQPEAIPYVTSYYAPTWGFCISDEQRKSLKSGNYHVRVDTEFSDGPMRFGELVLRGESDQEILFTTYICHPNMANDNVSGIVVLAQLASFIERLPSRKFTYRILFLPETIGAIHYVNEHLDHLKQNVAAGWVLSCVGDDRVFSFIPSLHGDTYADRVSRTILSDLDPSFLEYSFLDRGSDERQFCAPGVGLPVCSITRSKHREFPEYHTSLDDLSVISPEGLSGALKAYVMTVLLLENNRLWRSTTVGEPMLSKRKLHPTVGIKGIHEQVRAIKDVLAYCDGSTDVLGIIEKTGLSPLEVLDTIALLERSRLVES